MAATNVLFPRPASATEAAARGATAPVLAIRHAAQPTTMLRVLIDNGLVTDTHFNESITAASIVVFDVMIALAITVSHSEFALRARSLANVRLECRE